MKNTVKRPLPSRFAACWMFAWPAKLRRHRIRCAARMLPPPTRRRRPRNISAASRAGNQGGAHLQGPAAGDPARRG